MKNRTFQMADRADDSDIDEAIAVIKARGEGAKADAFAAEVGSFLVDLIADISWLMADRGVSQAELARRLGCSEARVSKLLGATPGAANMTAATIARIMGALGEKVEITSARLKELKGEAPPAGVHQGWAFLLVKAEAVVGNENHRLPPASRTIDWKPRSNGDRPAFRLAEAAA